MSVKKISAIFFAAIAFLVLLGCVEQFPAAPACGDGICSGDENCSSCPEDCGQCTKPLKEQVVGPDYYDSEQEAFDALGEELHGMEELSSEELESLLGE